MVYTLTVSEEKTVLDIPQHGTVIRPHLGYGEANDTKLIHEATGWDMNTAGRAARALRPIISWSRNAPNSWVDDSLRLDLSSVMFVADIGYIDIAFAGAINGYSFLANFRTPNTPERVTSAGDVFISMDNLHNGVDTAEYTAPAPRPLQDALQDTPYEPFGDLMDGYTFPLVGAWELETIVKS